MTMTSDLREAALEYHRLPTAGKISVTPTKSMVTQRDLALAYSLGVAFFAWQRLPFNHAIWHLFVLGGSVCHVLAACLFVLR